MSAASGHHGSRAPRLPAPTAHTLRPFIFVPQISRGVRAQPEGGSAPLPVAPGAQH
jgi:hypothetical protein